MAQCEECVVQGSAFAVGRFGTRGPVGSFQGFVDEVEMEVEVVCLVVAKAAANPKS